MTVVEVFADVTCPFTHVGLRLFLRRRAELGRDDVMLWVRAWPLEIVNGASLDPLFVADEIEAMRAHVAPDLFAGFRTSSFPATSLPALGLAAAGYRQDVAVGELVSLALRDQLFERGSDISDPAVLDEIAREIDVPVVPGDAERVLADHAEGARRGVIGSPHFFTPTGSFFCPSLDVHRDDDDRLVVAFDSSGFGQFMDSCFG